MSVPPAAAEDLDHGPPDRVNEPGIVIHLVIDRSDVDSELCPNLNNGRQGAARCLGELQRSGPYHLTFRLNGHARVELNADLASPECTERPLTPITAPNPPARGSVVPVQEPMAEPELLVQGRESVAVAEPIAERPQRSSVAISGEAVEMYQPPIQVVCFGTPRVMCAGQQIWPGSGGDAKPWELLLYLACQPAEGVPRQAVMRALWRDKYPGEQDAHRLRQLRYRLRRQLQQVTGAPDKDGICHERHRLRLDPGLIRSDAQKFDALVRSARSNHAPDAIEQLRQARTLYTDDLLQGYGARRYAWIDERDGSGVTLREHFRCLLHKASERLADLYAEAGELSAAIDLYRELTEVDPAHDRLWLALFRLHARRGDRNALMAEERRLRQMLRNLSNELDAGSTAAVTEPSQEVVQEFHRLISRSGQPVELQCSDSVDRLRFHGCPALRLER